MRRVPWLMAGSTAALMVACAGAESAADVVLVDETEAAADLKAWAGGMSPSQEGDVLRAVDAACAQGWCQGEASYRFKRLACDFGAGTCTLSAVVLPAGKDTGYPRACRFRGLSSLDALVSPAGADARLTAGFFDKVDACVGKWAGTLR